MTRPVAIVGGGLAGIAAALRLAEAGRRPIVIETRKHPGGGPTGVVDPRSGQVLDNCQHVLLGCCTNLIDLYDRLGVADRIEWHRSLYWTRGHGLVDEVRAGPLPAPIHLAGAFRRLRLFETSHKREIRRAMWRLVRLGARGRVEWRDRTFAEFLASCKQPEAVVRGFWETIVVSACNLGVDRVAAPVAMQVFQDGFLANRWSYTMGLPTVPLLDLYGPAVTRIKDAGGDVQTGVSARAIAFDGERVTGVVTADGLVEASIVVAAVPPDRLARLVSGALQARDPRLESLDRMETSPILAVHLAFVHGGGCGAPVEYHQQGQVAKGIVDHRIV